MTDLPTLDYAYGPCDVRAMARRIDHRSRLAKLEYYAGLNVRIAMVANALSVLNVQAGDPQTVRIFDDLLGPPFGWPLHKPFNKGGLSTCSMVAIGLLRRLGVANNSIMEGYTISSGMRVAHAWARALGAFMPPSTTSRPLPGDIIDLCPYACPYPGTGKKDRSNHTEVCIGYTRGDEIVCVSGGQVGRGRLQAITITRRPWKGTMAGQRDVYGWIDVEMLEYRGPVVVPEGWDQ